jgi:hypothetical protein
MRKSITYFEEPGPQNTDAVIAAVKERISDGDIQNVVVASESGKTALALVEALRGMDVNVACVAPYPGYQHVLKRTWPPMEKAIRSRLDALGVRVLDQTPWIFGCTFDTAFLKDSAPATIVHKFLSRAFGFGVKTCIEVALIAAEAGALEWDKDAIAVAGTGWLGGGADAAIVVRPSPVYGGAFLKNEGGLEVREILAMPRVKFSERLIDVMKKAGKDEPI